MTPEQRVRVKEWVAALRSGKYKQGRLRLKTEDGRFCCLGVACDLFIQQHEGYYWYEDSAPCMCDSNNFPVASFYMPDIVQEWLGLPNGTDVEAPPPCVGKVGLPYYNDTREYSFKLIADLIEKEFLCNTQSDPVVV